MVEVQAAVVVDDDIAVEAAAPGVGQGKVRREVARRVVHVPEILYHWRMGVGSAAGDSDAQVQNFLVARYGEFVLLKPRFERQTLRERGISWRSCLSSRYGPQSSSPGSTARRSWRARTSRLAWRPAAHP